MGTMTFTVLATASEVATEVAKNAPAVGGVGLGAVLLGVIALLLGSSVVGNIVTAVMTSLRASAEARRQRYAAAVELLAARIEYPYRVRRRTSNDPETLTKLPKSATTFNSDWHSRARGSPRRTRSSVRCSTPASRPSTSRSRTRAARPGTQTPSQSRLK